MGLINHVHQVRSGSDDPLLKQENPEAYAEALYKLAITTITVTLNKCIMITDLMLIHY